MKNQITCGIMVLAGIAYTTEGAGHVDLKLVPRAASIEPGGTIVVDIYGNLMEVSSGMVFAGWKFDITGHLGGTLTGDVNEDLFPIGVNNGLQSGPNLLDFGGGRLPPGFDEQHRNDILFGTVTFTDHTLVGGYQVHLNVVDLYAPQGDIAVFTGASLSRSHPTQNTGGFHIVNIFSTPFTVVPAPGNGAILGLGLLAARRRR